MTLSSSTSQLLLAGRALAELAWRAVRGRGERLVAAPAPPARGDDDLLAAPVQVAQDVAPVAVVDDGPGRDGDDEVFGLAARAAARLALAAGVGAPVLAG